MIINLGLNFIEEFSVPLQCYPEYNHRTLIVDNKGKGPEKQAISDYSDLSQDASRAWILSSSGNHSLSGNCG